MGAAAVDGPGDDQLGSAAPTHPGRIVIHERVLVRVSEQAAAQALSVSRSEVAVQISAARGGMAVSISSRLPTPDLDDADACRSAIPVLDRVAAVQEQLGYTITELTGRQVSRVNVTVTGALTTPKRRVR